MRTATLGVRTYRRTTCYSQHQLAEHSVGKRRIWLEQTIRCACSVAAGYSSHTFLRTLPYGRATSKAGRLIRCWDPGPYTLSIGPQLSCGLAPRRAPFRVRRGWCRRCTTAVTVPPERGWAVRWRSAQHPHPASRKKHEQGAGHLRCLHKHLPREVQVSPHLPREARPRQALASGRNPVSRERQDPCPDVRRLISHGAWQHRR